MIIVTGNEFHFQHKTYRCAIGKGGFASDKKEGDGATPIGLFSLRECWYRDDRLKMPTTKLPLRIISENDGWCDDPESAEYNLPIKLPYPASHEKLWRESHVYDLVIPIGYNDSPIVAGKGSAIFMHLAHDDYRPTEGCVALCKKDFLDILPRLSVDTRIEIKQK